MMLSNLVSNAIKFTQAGFVRIEVSEIDDPARSAQLEFSVSDSGPGISPEKQPLLFQAYSQTDNATARRYGGTGLGLFNVRNLAELMGGEAGVQSAIGKGARFWFRVRASVVVGGQPNYSAPDPGSAELAVDKRVDRAQAQTMVAEIEPLIAHNKFASIGRFRLLQEFMAGTVVAAELAQTERLLGEFRFDLALDRLGKVVASPLWQEATHD
jgi:hypothetical protein